MNDFGKVFMLKTMEQNVDVKSGVKNRQKEKVMVLSKIGREAAMSSKNVNFLNGL